MNANDAAFNDFVHMSMEQDDKGVQGCVHYYAY
jgi:hypothetical protein